MQNPFFHDSRFRAFATVCKTRTIPDIVDIIKGSKRARSHVVPLLLRPKSSGPLLLETLEQVVWLPVEDEDGRWIALTIDTADNGTRLDAVEAMAVGRTPYLIVVLATCETKRLVLSPIGIMATPNDPLVHLDVAVETSLKPSSAKASRIKQAVRDGMKRGFGALRPRDRRVGAFARAKAPGAATAALLALAHDDLLALAELGGRMQDPECFIG